MCNQFSVVPTVRRVVWCYRQGSLLWTDQSPNLVTTVGKNKLLDACFKTGLTSPVWYVGMVDNASFTAYAAADTMSSHTGWIESTIYSESVRQTWTPGTIASGSVDNSASKAVFTINAGGTIRGLFFASSNTKSGTSGTLYGEGDLAASRTVITGDVLNIQVTLTV